MGIKGSLGVVWYRNRMGLVPFISFPQCSFHFSGHYIEQKEDKIAGICGGSGNCNEIQPSMCWCLYSQIPWGWLSHCLAAMVNGWKWTWRNRNYASRRKRPWRTLCFPFLMETLADLFKREGVMLDSALLLKKQDNATTKNTFFQLSLAHKVIPSLHMADLST